MQEGSVANKKAYTNEAATERVRLLGKDEIEGRFLSAEQVARILDVSPRTVLRWANEGWPPATRISPRLWRFDGDELLRLLEGKEAHN